jgi:hypothetical protein
MAHVGYYSPKNIQEILTSSPRGNNPITKAAIGLLELGLFGFHDAGVTAKNQFRPRDSLINQICKDAERCARVNAPGTGYLLAGIIANNDLKRI